MNKSLYILLLFYLLTSCGSTNKLPNYSNAPQWVQEHPLSDKYYIGIGVSKKRGVSDYRELAKKNALSEISSSISVLVSVNSVLKQQDYEGKFKEMFDSTTKTYTENELQGSKQVARWENKYEYWVYYKLSKEKVEQRKREAIEDASISLKRALKYDAENDYPRAISNYSLALSAVKPYLGSRIKTKFNDETIFLGQYILDHYRALITSVKLSYDSNEQLIFKPFKPIKPLKIKLSRGNSSLANIPLKIESSTFKYKGFYKFDDNGEVILPEISANTYRREESVILSVDVEQMINESVSDDLVKEILKNYKTTYLKLKYKKEKSSRTKRIMNKMQEKMDEMNDALIKSIDGIDNILIKNKNIGNLVNKEVSISKTNNQELPKVIKENAFEDDKIITLKNYLKTANRKYYTTEIAEVVKQFNFEENKLEVAKICYPYTIDKSNYYTLNSLFNFNDSKKELSKFINEQN